jgi:hypothetical protein
MSEGIWQNQLKENLKAEVYGQELMNAWNLPSLESLLHFRAKKKTAYIYR